MFVGQNHLNSSQLLCHHWMCTGLSLLDSIWVQAQLKNHPDEIWEDGVRDYLAHASNIMEKFSDVVKWLKTNTVKGGTAAESLGAEKNLVPEVNNNESKLFQGKTGFVSPSTNTSFTASCSSGLFSSNQSSGGVFSSSQSSGMLTSNQNSGLFSKSPGTGFHSSGLFSNSQSSALSSANQSIGLFSTSQGSAGSFTNQSSGLFSNSQSSGLSSGNQSSGFFSSNQSAGVFSSTSTPSLFGSQNLASTNNNTSDDVDDENEPEQPSSPSVKKSEEKGIVVVHEVKCKLYVKSSDPADKDTWKDKGTGQLSIKCKEDVGKGTKESKPTIVVRNDVGRVLLNALLYPGIKTNAQKNSLVAIFHTAGDDGGNSENVVARTFLIRTKTEEDRNKLATAIQEYAPAS
ncbi:nucleoporin NUP152 isoform X2 [Hevea brasiliensis]|uniref:nucleoporin NUP152 isoform X2 n=1 Tax=Hevea brasiliensis TaxID=3981 RepID=UPI0025DCE775|nr:nucleoporin NUP152 isoform X2 [Hevea brasiliensis]